MVISLDELRRASRLRRIFSFLLDIFILSLIEGLILNILLIFNIDLSWTSASHTAHYMAQMPFHINAHSGIIFMFLFLFKDSFNGISPGRYIMGISVRMNDDFEKVPSILLMAVRNLFLILVIIEFFVMLFHPRKRRLGDMLAGTAVVREAHSKPLAFFLILIAIFLFGFLVRVQLQHSYNLISSIKEAVQIHHDIKERVGTIEDIKELNIHRIIVENGDTKLKLDVKIVGEDENLHATITIHKTPDQIWVVEKIEFNAKNEEQ